MAARALIGSTFVALSYGAWREPGARVGKAAPVLARLRTMVPFIPESDEDAVRLNAAVQTAAGIALTVGVAPRLASTALLASLIPTTIAGHAFWKITDPATRRGQRMHFQKNAAMLGGLILSALPAARAPRRVTSAARRTSARARRAAR
jgi:uncharacterized membrane protein YphA (DoxX/SURF4 family)